jgi:hypothetical protein
VGECTQKAAAKQSYGGTRAVVSHLWRRQRGALQAYPCFSR